MVWTGAGLILISWLAPPVPGGAYRMGREDEGRPKIRVPTLIVGKALEEKEKWLKVGKRVGKGEAQEARLKR